MADAASARQADNSSWSLDAPLTSFHSASDDDRLFGTFLLLEATLGALTAALDLVAFLDGDFSKSSSNSILPTALTRINARIKYSHARR